MHLYTGYSIKQARILVQEPRKRTVNALKNGIDLARFSMIWKGRENPSFSARGVDPGPSSSAWRI
jgi:hypothetical protein